MSADLPAFDLPAIRELIQAHPDIAARLIVTQQRLLTAASGPATPAPATSAPATSTAPAPATAAAPAAPARSRPAYSPPPPSPPPVRRLPTRSFIRFPPGRCTFCYLGHRRGYCTHDSSECCHHPHRPTRLANRRRFNRLNRRYEPYR